MKPASILIVLLFGIATRVAQAADAVDWGGWRVQFKEHWQGAEPDLAGKDLTAGIGLCMQPGSAGNEIFDYEMRHSWEGDAGFGVAGLLDTTFRGESRIEAVSFGRTENKIQMVLAIHDTGGTLPALVKKVVRQKMNLPKGSRAEVTFDQARAEQVTGKQVLFAADFPDDLPPGIYQVTVELRNDAGKAVQRYQKKLVRAAVDKKSLAGLSDAQLLQEYVKRGEALKEAPTSPTDDRRFLVPAEYVYAGPREVAWGATRSEIIHRGAEIAPMLIEMLEAEAVRNPRQTAQFGFAIDVMQMLTKIGDPRALPLLTQIMAGMGGKANMEVRWAAVKTAEKMTFMSFGIEPIYGSYLWNLGALPPTEKGIAAEDASLILVSGLYRDWLKGDGKDPKTWLTQARGRARNALGGSNKAAIINAITFLAGYESAGHDDNPTDTMRAIAAVAEKLDLEDLPTILPEYKPAERPLVESMIRRAHPLPEYYSFWELGAAGGEKAMAYAIGALPMQRKRVDDESVDVDADVNETTDVAAGLAVEGYRSCRWVIELWSGRTFVRDDDIAEWWDKAKGRTQREWLEANLDRTSAEADQGNAKAQTIIRRALPDLPFADDDRHFDPRWPWGRGYRENQPGPYRVQWLKENRPKLRYDEQRSLFRVR